MTALEHPLVRFAIAFAALVVGGIVTLDLGAFALAAAAPCRASASACANVPEHAALYLGAAALLALAVTVVAISATIRARMVPALAGLGALVAMLWVLPHA